MATVHESELEVSRYGSYEDSPTEGTKLLYTSTAFRATARIVPLDVSEPTSMRGPSAVTGAFALETAIDEVAERLRIDPIELRLRNEPDRDQSTGTPFSTRWLTERFRQGADTFGWARRNPTPRAVRDGDQLVGMGTAAARYHTLRSESSAMARLNADGTAEVFAAASDIGPGTYTSMTQVAADALGLPMDRIRFSLGVLKWTSAAARRLHRRRRSRPTGVHPRSDGRPELNSDRAVCTARPRTRPQRAIDLHSNLVGNIERRP